ncbi:MAG TPA: hypothetical protein VHE30_07970 [Polyangiaceae bacterium]|nr:hypothetical protein [Polyangiaceae bacterium]
MPRSTSSLSLVPLILVAVLFPACGGDVRVAERAAQEPPSGSRDSGPSPPAPSATGVPIGFPSHVYPPTNDLCDAVGIIILNYLPATFDPVISGTGYVVGFDPPGVLGSAILTDPYGVGTYYGELDSRNLQGSPSCETLRSDARFAVFDRASGPVVPTSESPATFNVRRMGSGCDSSVSATSDLADRVRAFGMVPGSNALDGPLELQSNSRGDFGGVVDVATFPRCADPNFLVITVGHSGPLLVGLSVYGKDS